MIYTCTLNPAVDYIINLPVLESNKLNRIDQSLFRAGGKGINVAVVLNNLGINNVALGFLGGFTGSFIKTDLALYPLIQSEFIDIEGTTRINIKLNHGHKETDINDKGPKISDHDFQKLMQRIKKLTTDDLLICSGSSCVGQNNAYLEIAKLCNQNNVKFIMDVSGKEVLSFLDQKPFLIKPNLEELEEYFDIKIGSMDELVEYGRKLIDLGAQNVLISMGSKGSLFINKQHIYKASLIHGHAINTTGAGDSMIAGFVSSFVENQDLKKAYLDAVSAGSATVFGDSLATQDTLKTYQKRIKIKEIHI